MIGPKLANAIDSVQVLVLRTIKPDQYIKLYLPRFDSRIGNALESAHYRLFVANIVPGERDPWHIV